MKLLSRFFKICKRLNSSREFRSLQRGINKKTYLDHLSIIRSAEMWESNPALPNSSEKIVLEGKILRESVLKEFHKKHLVRSDLRVLVHVPLANISPAGFSIFSNIIDTLRYMGVRCVPYYSGDSIVATLDSFKPSIFLSSDNPVYLNQLDWNAIDQYKKNHQLRIGLTASIEAYGSAPLEGRLRWAKKHGIDFFYSFRAREYFQDHSGYRLFYDEGYKIHSIEFGANVLLYFPVDVVRDLPFVFLGSSNSDKRGRYIEWIGSIFRDHPGFINGPGWKNLNYQIPMNLNRYIYSRAKVGINLHLAEQILSANELNERTYTLAACGVPQLIDNPRLLSARFSKDSMFKANTPREYIDLFHYMLESPAEAELRALVALREVFSKHTTFHRVDSFINEITKISA